MMEIEICVEANTAVIDLDPVDEVRKNPPVFEDR